jgi:glutamate dehydrogenase
MLIEGRRLLERATRWLVRRSPDEIDIAATIERFEPGAKLLASSLPDALQGEDREVFDRRVADLGKAGVPKDLVSRVAAMPSMLPALDIVEVAAATDRDAEAVMALYFGLGARLELTWLRDRITELPRTNRWQALARGSLRDELYTLHRALTQEVLEASDSESQRDAALEQWSKQHAPALDRCLTILHEIRVSRNYELTTMSVALREIRNLIRGGKAQLTDAARL